MDAQLRARLKSFAESLQGPLGMIPLDRAIRADLDLFRMLKASGATWVQIANALAIVGVRRPNGSLLSADHLRSTISRQLKRSKEDEAEHNDCVETCPQHPIPWITSETSSSGTKPNLSNLDKDTDTALNNKTISENNSFLMRKLERTRKLRKI